MGVRKFVAESVAAYSVEPGLPKPWRDEDCGMSGPEKFGVADGENEALELLRKELAVWADYYEAGAARNEAYAYEAKLFRAAEQVVAAGSTAVKVHGRYYRVREV